MPVVGASLSPKVVTVEPGGQATCTLTLQNVSQGVQRLSLEVHGDAAPWTEVEAGGLSLLPGQQRDVVVRFRPPRGSDPLAGNVPFAIKATPREAPDESVVEEGDVVVDEFVSTTAAIEPATSAGFRRARHLVQVHNGGNTPISVQLSATDPQQLVDVEVSPSELALDAGFVGRARVRVGAHRGSGSEPRIRPFQVTVRTAGGGTLTLDAALRLRGFPLAVVAPVLATVAALVLGGVLYANRSGRVRDAVVAAPAPSTTAAGVTTAPSAPATTAGPRTTASGPTATTTPGSGEAAALAMGAPCRTTTDLRTTGRVLTSPDGAFVRQFPDETTARAARDLLARNGTVCTIGDPAAGDSLLTFHPPPVEPTPNVPGSRCSPRYTPATLTKNQTSQTFAVDIGPTQHLLYAKAVDRDRAFALLQGHTQICWLGGGTEDIFSTFFDWTTAVTYF